MSARDDDDLHFLLAGGRLSGAQHDRILDEAVRQAEARPPRRWLTWLAAGLVPVAAAVALVVWTSNGAERSHAVAKGTAAGVVLQIRCPGREPGRCRQGDRLLFEVDGAGQGGLLAAYAQHEAGARVWYFPTSDGHLGAVPATGGHVLVGEGARLGDEHPPGRYDVHLYLLDSAADRADLVAGRVHARAESVVPLQILAP